VLRWWFTLNYDAVYATPDRNAFELRGQGVKVLSENELLTERGERVHTGQTDELNEQFAHAFTKNFPALATKYPIYADLQNVFDLALVAALIKAEEMPARTDWHLTCFGDPTQYAPATSAAPKSVESVMSNRVLNQVHIVAAVSGGVSVDPQALVEKEAIRTASGGALGCRWLMALPSTGPITKPRPMPAPTRPMPAARSGPDVTSATAAWQAARLPAVAPARMRDAKSNGSHACSAATAKISIATPFPKRLARMMGRRP